MTISKRLFWRIAAPTALGVLVVWLVWARVAPRSRPSVAPVARSAPQEIVNALPLVGTPSCSARGCHGGIEPAVDAEKCQQNEYTRWTQDRHADAYRTLFSERSQDIVKRLGGGKKAHEEPRCLACHTNPLLASLPQDHAFAKEERLFGVGCESCHGSAKTWLAAHTAPDWRQKKHAHTMPDLSDPAIAAKSCAGCHVGAPASLLPPGEGSRVRALPLRDVNHDLVAAGHPRLNFEFATYQANMPAHWRPSKQPEERRWAAGQIASAQASLELLAHRAKSGPWPEFAEYDCFACHHGLAAPTWRQTGKVTERKPGSLPWGTWYFALVADSPELKKLRSTMQTPYPVRTRVAEQAEEARAQLKEPDNQERKQLMVRIQEITRSGDPTWDHAEQAFLALHALNQSQPDPALAKLLGELTPLRAFPPGFDGPRRFDPRNFSKKIQSLK